MALNSPPPPPRAVRIQCEFLLHFCRISVKGLMLLHHRAHRHARATPAGRDAIRSDALQSWPPEELWFIVISYLSRYAPDRGARGLCGASAAGVPIRIAPASGWGLGAGGGMY